MLGYWLDYRDLIESWLVVDCYQFVVGTSGLGRRDVFAMLLKSISLFIDMMSITYASGAGRVGAKSSGFS